MVGWWLGWDGGGWVWGWGMGRGGGGEERRRFIIFPGKFCLFVVGCGGEGVANDTMGFGVWFCFKSIQATICKLQEHVLLF